MIDNTREYIACAAIWYNDGTTVRPHNPPNIKTGIVVCGLRHCNCFTILFALYPKRDYMQTQVSDDAMERATTQGFLSSTGEFKTRAEAYAIAINNGQCEPCKTEILMSEDIY